MSQSSIHPGRRRLLIAATSVVGAAGAAAVATPFLASWSPSARALAAGAPATNLVVPPYYFKDDNTILIGEDGNVA